MIIGEYEVPGELLNIPVDDELSLRQLRVDEAQTLFDLVHGCPEHISNFGNPLLEIYATIDTLSSAIEQQDGDDIMLGIWRGGDELVGLETLTGYYDDIKGTTASVNIGYCLGEQYTGHHYAARAVKPTIDFLLEICGIPQVDAYIRSGNVASALTAQAAGMKFVAMRYCLEARDYWIFMQAKEWPEKFTHRFSNCVRTEELYEKPGKKWVKLDGVDVERVEDNPVEVHVETGELTIVRGGTASEHLNDGDTSVINKDERYRMVGLATMYAIPARTHLPSVA